MGGFMNRLVKSARWAEPHPIITDTPPVSAHRPFNQQGCARERVDASVVVKPLGVAGTPARRLILLFALLCGTQRAGAQRDPKEEQRSLWDGSHVRPNAHARLLLQLDNLSGYSADPTPRSMADAVRRTLRTGVAWYSVWSRHMPNKMRARRRARATMATFLPRRWVIAWAHARNPVVLASDDRLMRQAAWISSDCTYGCALRRIRPRC